MNETHSTRNDSNSEVLPLFEFSKIVNSSLDLQFVLSTLLLTLMGKFLFSKGVVLLRALNNHFKIEIAKGLPQELIGNEFVFDDTDDASPFLLADSEMQFVEALQSRGITRLFPIISHQKISGYFGIGERQPLNAGQLRFVQTLINISGAAIEKALTFDELKNVNRNLDGKIQQLRALFELAKEFSSVLEEERLIKLFSLTLMGQIGTNRYAICLKDGRSIVSRISEEYLNANKSMLFETVKEPTLITDELLDGKFVELKSCIVQEKIKAVIPLQVQNEAKGILCLGDRMRGGTYTQTDLEFLYSLSNLAFVSLENSRLFQEAIEKKKMESELETAREIQKGLLPRMLPQIPNFEISAVNVSSKQVGGDYYDVIPLPDENYIIAIADVSGKGTPASLLMANVQATLRALAPFNLELPEATARVNNIINENTASDTFITFFWGKLNSATKEFSYVNAGHNPPFVLRADGTIERLEEGGIILGIMKTIVPYRQGSIKLNSGDTVILFTDGVSEAMDKNGNDYTEERLEEFVKNLLHKSAAETLCAITDEITSYAYGAPQSDDITLVVFKAL